MRSYGRKPRTRADSMRDLLSWCVSARREMVEATTDEDLARRHGVSIEVAREHRARRLGQAW